MRPFLLLLLALISPLEVTAQERIPLVLDSPEEASASSAFPVYCGLSLPKGAVKESAEIGVVDGDGHPVVADVEAICRWTPDTSLKWVGLHFLAKKGGKYFAVMEPDRSPAGLVVRDTAASIVIETGAATFELP